MAEELLATCRHHGRKVNQLISAVHKMAPTVKADAAQLQALLNGDAATLRTWQGALLLQQIAKTQSKMADYADVR